MGMDIHGREPTTESGEYFRANIWGWPPILSIALAANEVYGLGFDMSAWSFNDGAGLDTQEDCTKLAEAMEQILTMEEPVLKAEHSPTAKAFASALGVTDMGEQAETSNEHAQEFITFLRGCGGFQIC